MMYSDHEYGPARYNAEVAKYKEELELLQTSYRKTSKPAPFSRDQCQRGVPELLSELSANPGPVITYMVVATMGGAFMTIMGIFSGMILMAYDTGIEGVLRMTHTSIREWAALMNGDVSNCKKFIAEMNGGVNGKWVNVAKAKNEVVRDPGVFIADALSFAGGFDVTKVIHNAEKGGETAEAFPSRWTDFVVGLPSALQLEYMKEGREGFLGMITPKVRESIQGNCSPREM
jgi:hypothetical protein